MHHVHLSLVCMFPLPLLAPLLTLRPLLPLYPSPCPYPPPQVKEEYLKKVPMNNRQQTYEAIRKLLASLDDPFTKFLEPERLQALRRGTAGAPIQISNYLVGRGSNVLTGGDGACACAAAGW